MRGGAKAAADEQMSFVFSKKKAVVAEKRQKKEQKEEAEKHIRMQKELVRLGCRSTCHSPSWIAPADRGEATIEKSCISHIRRARCISRS